MTAHGQHEKGGAPAPGELLEEFATWCRRHEFERIPDDGVLVKLLDRRQRWWLTNFIARWDWATEAEALQPRALCTPLELAGAFMALVREHSSRGEFERVLSRQWVVGDYLDVDSVMAMAFARLHHVPIDSARSPRQRQAYIDLKHAALVLVDKFMVDLPKG